MRLRSWWVRTLLMLSAVTVAGWWVLPGIGARKPPPGPVVPARLEQYTPAFKDYLAPFIAAVQANPADGRLHAQLAVVYEANRLWPEARDSFENALRVAGADEALTLYHLAMVHARLGDVQAAESLLRRAVANHPRFAPAQHYLGDLLLERHDLDGAAACFQRVLELAPQELAGYCGLAEVALGRGDHARALGLLGPWAQRGIESRLLHHLLGRAYRGLGRQAEAERELLAGAMAQKLYLADEWSATFARHTPGRSLAERLQQAHDYLRFGDLRQATRLLEYALEWHPREAEVYNKLAAVHSMAGRDDQAQASLERALLIDPLDCPTLSNLASLYLKIGRLPEGLSHAERGIAQCPAVAALHLTRGRILLAQGQLGEARRALRQAALLDPNSPAARELQRLERVGGGEAP